MEQEETKTTAAAGVEMPPEAESWVQLHESELTELMQKQAKAAITELKRQEKQERKKEKYHNTFTLMKCYRDAVFHIENAISDGQQLELKGDGRAAAYILREYQTHTLEDIDNASAYRQGGRRDRTP